MRRRRSRPAPDTHVISLDDEARRRIINRLRRAHGQLAAVIEAVEEGKECRDVVTQLAATSKALDRAGVLIISNAMRECLTTPPPGEVAMSVDELEKLFMMLA